MPSDRLAAVLADENLWRAWEQVRAKDSAPGLDGQAVRSVARDPEMWLRRLRGDILRGRYRPWPLRRLYLPKASGGWRPIGVPALRDRVAQRAVLQVLQPLAEPLFNESSYAYRPGRGLAEAVAAVCRARGDGLRHVLEADIDDCFGSLDRQLVDQAIDRVATERDLRRLIGLWLDAGYAERGRVTVPARGVAQGDILSPLWCNLYLDRLDDVLDRLPGRLVRYADDLIILCRTHRGVERAAQHLVEITASLRLELEPTKTGATSFAEGFCFLGVEFMHELAVPLSRRWSVDRHGRVTMHGAPAYEAATGRRPRAGPSRLEAALNREAGRASRAGRPPTAMTAAWAEAVAEAEAADEEVLWL